MLTTLVYANIVKSGFYLSPLIGVCPKGKTIRGIPTFSSTTSSIDINTLHSTYSECSNNGLCNRKTGQCECFKPFNGTACDRCKKSMKMLIQVFIFTFYAMTYEFLRLQWRVLTTAVDMVNVCR